MTKAANGDTVKVHYKGTLNDGTEFDSSAGTDPLQFTLGSGQVIPGFDNGVLGMEVNEKKSINIPAAEAYGQKRDEMFVTVPRAELPPEIEPQVGMPLQMQNQDGQVINVLISEVTDESLTLDANHPLAGQDLNFDLELVEICK